MFLDLKKFFNVLEIEEKNIFIWGNVIEILIYFWFIIELSSFYIFGFKIWIEFWNKKYLIEVICMIVIGKFLLLSVNNIFNKWSGKLKMFKLVFL